VERSFQHGETSGMPFKNKQLFRNSRPTPIDKEKIRVRKASDNSKSSRRKAYDKLRQTAEPETESGNIYYRSKVGETAQLARPDSPVHQNNQTEKTVRFDHGDELQPSLTTPRTQNLLEQILGANVTPLKETHEDHLNSLFQTLEPPRTTAFEDVASVGKAIGNAIVHGIYTAQKENDQETSKISKSKNNFQKLTSPDAPSEPISSKPSYSADKNALKIKLSPVNPIRINRTSVPPKTEADSLKTYLRGIVKAKSNLDQNFKYL